MSNSEAVGGETIWLTSFEDVHEALLLKDGLIMASYDAAKEVVFNNVLITLDGDPHWRRRRLESPLLAPRRVSELEARVVPAIADREILAAASTGEADIVELAGRIATAAIARVIGLDAAVESDDGAAILTDLMQGLHAGATIEYTKLPWADVQRRALLAKEQYDKIFVTPALRSRRAGSVVEAEQEADLISLLVADAAENPDEWDHDRLVCETIHYLVAGGGTTTLSVVAAMSELLGLWEIKPHLRAVMLDEPDYLQQAVHEAIRLHPPSAYAMRHAVHDIRLRSGATIEAGRTVALDLRKANRDPGIFGDDADTFNPDRELHASAPYGLSFGAGSHVCVGKRLAAGTSKDLTPKPLGSVTRIVEALVRNGCVKHPTRMPVPKTDSTRKGFDAFPVAFDESLRHQATEVSQ